MRKGGIMTLVDQPKTANDSDKFLIIKFGSYLQELRAIEYSKPPRSRRHVPTFSDLSRATGAAVSTVSRLARGDVDELICHCAVLL